MILNYTKDDSTVMLYDDNLLKDEMELNQNNAPEKVFALQALALNNALFTITSPTGFLLAGDLKTVDTFDKAALVLSFGLIYIRSSPA